MKCKFLCVVEAASTAPDSICFSENGKRFIKEGAEYEHVDAYKLVHAGYAECTDEECRAKIAELNPDHQGIMRQVHNRIMSEQQEFIDELEAEEAEENDDDDE
tara:strand:+ start:131 stop:439 length:309 start_codon:yes stop_codon:yes gene_type:complete